MASATETATGITETILEPTHPTRTMKTRLPKLAKCPTTARSVLECASPLPLLERGCVKDQPQHRPLARTAAGRDDTAALQRGCKSATGLAHSKSWRLLVALWAFVGSWL